MGTVIINTDPKRIWGDDWKPTPSQTPEEYRDYLYANNQHYNQYLTIDITNYNEPQDIRFIIPAEIGTDLVTSVSYSRDNGLNWITVNNVDNTQKQLYIDGQDFDESTKILFKGVAKQYAANINGTMKYCYFRFGTGANGSDIYGNILSMFYGENFADEVGFPENSSFNCYYMFKDAKCTNIKNIILPVLTTEGCYINMFNGHVNVTKTPLLPATTLSPWCYQGMFDLCELDCIQILATDISAEYCLSGYIDDDEVAASGTFIKNANADASMFGGYIPTGWTVKNYEPVQMMKMYIDKFPLENEDYPDYWKDAECETLAEYKEYMVDNYTNCDGYIYDGDTLEVDGTTYYLWKYIDDDGYASTTTNDYNTLYYESLENNINNAPSTSLFSWMFDGEDITGGYLQGDEVQDQERYIVKVIKL